jgi:serine/threonine-protein kinase
MWRRKARTVLGTTIGNYRVTAQLGEGGMGIVYLAEHPALGRKAAIKVLHQRLAADPQVVSRFFQEARASNAIRHPNIVEAYDYGTLPDGASYIIMEYLDGESLAARLRRRGRLPLRTALELAHQTAGALSAAHAQSIVHRDLKPDNLYLTRDPRSPGVEVIKVLDFGIAKLAASVDSQISHKTRTGTLMGTPLYMSPEQCLGVKEVDHRSDIYSLGCILFEMLCGEPPFVSEGFGALVNMHINQAPEKPSRRNPDVPSAVDRIILKLLAKSADERYADMQSVQAALAPEIARAPVPPAAAETLPAVGVSGGRVMHAATTLSDASAAVGTEEIPRRRRGMGPVLAVVGAVAVVGAFVASRFMSGDRAARPPVAAAPAPVPVAQPAVPATPPPPAPAAAPTIEAALDSTPPGALVTIDGVAIGTTPMTWRTAPSEKPAALTFSLDGYRAEVIQARPAAGLRLAPTLKRLPPRHHAHGSPARPNRPSGGGGTADDIKSER